LPLPATTSGNIAEPSRVRSPLLLPLRSHPRGLLGSELLQLRQLLPLLQLLLASLALPAIVLFLLLFQLPLPLPPARVASSLLRLTTLLLRGGASLEQLQEHLQELRRHIRLPSAAPSPVAAPACCCGARVAFDASNRKERRYQRTARRPVILIVAAVLAYFLGDLLAG
jgi:hypothetical protein